MASLTTYQKAKAATLLICFCSFPMTRALVIDQQRPSAAGHCYTIALVILWSVEVTIRLSVTMQTDESTTR